MSVLRGYFIRNQRRGVLHFTLVVTLQIATYSPYKTNKKLAKTVFEGELLKTYIELSKIAFILMVIIYAA
jgi:hypothetical protein